MENTKSVFVALLGRPNVGKSSLMNNILGEKLAIVTRKPQTTRTRITGILTESAVQYVFTDTPGVHIPKTKLGERMINAGRKALADVDVAVMLFEPMKEFNEAETALLKDIKSSKLPAIAVINKTDLIKDKSRISQQIEEIEKTEIFTDVLLVSAVTGDGVRQLLEKISEHAVDGPHYFDDDSYTDIPEKEIVAEIVREKILMFMRDEIPHGTNVEVESFKERDDGGMIDLGIIIYCEKSSHKGMIIGKKGAMLKKIASRARRDIEQFLNTKVNMECWVKVKEDWRDSNFLLNDFGFKEE